SRLLLGCVAAFVAVVLIIQARTRRLIRIQLPDALHLRECSLIMPAAVLLFLFFIVCLHALRIAVIEWDTFAIWGLKAKVLAADSLRTNPEYFHDATFDFSHRDYPKSHHGSIPDLSATNRLRA